MGRTFLIRRYLTGVTFDYPKQVVTVGPTGQRKDWQPTRLIEDLPDRQVRTIAAARAAVTRYHNECSNGAEKVIEDRFTRAGWHDRIYRRAIIGSTFKDEQMARVKVLSQAWWLTEDLISDGPDDSAVGETHRDLVAINVKDTPRAFRILDDDGETYYRGQFLRPAWDAEEGRPESLYTALQWASWNAGATELQVTAETAIAMGIPSDKITSRWYSVFG